MSWQLLLELRRLKERVDELEGRVEEIWDCINDLDAAPDGSSLHEWLRELERRLGRLEAKLGGR
jgi:polyhydroxyalkanoate synthesis regulator phasin